MRYTNRPGLRSAEAPEAARSLEQELIHTLVRCLTEGVSTQMTGGGRRHDMIVAKFEEYLEANSNTPLYLVEICEAIGAAERTLRVACEEHLGMGPIRYLAMRRMHLARRALLRAASSTATATPPTMGSGNWDVFLSTSVQCLGKRLWRHCGDHRTNST